MTTWRKVGALWRSTKSSNAAVLYGEISDENGRKLRVSVYKNENPREGGREPDYRIAAADEWEIDEYFKRNKANRAEPDVRQSEVDPRPPDFV